ncbi:hypothetical protein BJY01DRAFT_252077 [Aspergillus pseudoustus]|uniref:Dihydrodipicolinate synthase n=1 Tax=Aspergillus pseudoustus TaxID=1810923 RepID=A0ABR4J8B5_9EURO
MADLYGIMVSLITPFMDDQKSIDTARLQAHVEHMIKAGIHGLVPGGSTGEFPSLSTTERKQLTELCVQFAAGRVPVIPGAGGLTSAETMELSIHAAQADAAAVMVVPPFYDPVNLDELKALLAEVYKRAQIPIVYYNIPSATGENLSPSELASLAQVGVKYLKDTSGDGPALTEMLFGLSDRIAAFNGWDTLTSYGLDAGAPRMSFRSWPLNFCPNDSNLLAITRVNLDPSELPDLSGRIQLTCRTGPYMCPLEYFDKESLFESTEEELTENEEMDQEQAVEQVPADPEIERYTQAVLDEIRELEDGRVPCLRADELSLIKPSNSLGHPWAPNLSIRP